MYKNCNIFIQNCIVTDNTSSETTEGPRPFALILIIVLAAFLLIGAGITYYVCCTKLEPIQKRKYPVEGKTTTTKKLTKNAPKTKKTTATKKKTKKKKMEKKKEKNKTTKRSKKEPKTLANLSADNKKSTVPRSALGDNKTKSKQVPKSNVSKSVGKSTANASAKGDKSGRPVSSKQSTMGSSQVNEEAAPPPLKRNIIGKNLSEVHSLGATSCTLSKESPVSKVAASAADSTAAGNHQKVTAKTKKPAVPRRDPKDGGRGKKSKKQQ